MIPNKIDWTQQFVDHWVEFDYEFACEAVKKFPRQLSVYLRYTPDESEIIYYRAENVWDDEDYFEEYARPSRPLTSDEQAYLRTTNERLAYCRPTGEVADEFLDFIAWDEIL